jgi:hypothetical protein
MPDDRTNIPKLRAEIHKHLLRISASKQFFNDDLAIDIRKHYGNFMACIEDDPSPEALVVSVLMDPDHPNLLGALFFLQTTGGADQPVDSLIMQLCGNAEDVIVRNASVRCLARRRQSTGDQVLLDFLHRLAQSDPHIASSCRHAINLVEGG